MPEHALQPTDLRRRQLLIAAGAGIAWMLPGAIRAGQVLAEPQADTDVDLTAGLQQLGSGSFRRLGFHVYDASLFAPSAASAAQLQAPLALRLEYRREIDAADIVDASLSELGKLGIDDQQRAAWAPLMANTFPNVKAGDAIIGRHEGHQARFALNEQPLGVIAAPGFADAFFRIWLDVRTSAPQLRRALLGEA
jgi:hypothetical protein